MARLSGTRRVQSMSLRWRVGLVAVIAAAVVGGFMPHAVVSATASSATAVVQMAESPLSLPTQCADAICGKGTPAPAAPSPGVVLAAVMGGAMVAAAAASSIRRRRRQAAVLPAGSPDPFFHPPQFS
jgi:hypothetical protein